MGRPKADPSALVVNEMFIEIVSEILKFFEGDIKKTKFWLITPNLSFGGIPPLKLMVAGKGNKVLAFIAHAKDESTPPDGYELKDGKLQEKQVTREWIFRAGFEGDGRPCVRIIEGPETGSYETFKVREILS